MTSQNGLPSRFEWIWVSQVIWSNFEKNVQMSCKLASEKRSAVHILLSATACTRTHVNVKCWYWVWDRCQNQRSSDRVTHECPWHQSYFVHLPCNVAVYSLADVRYTAVWRWWPSTHSFPACVSGRRLRQPVRGLTRIKLASMYKVGGAGTYSLMKPLRLYGGAYILPLAAHCECGMYCSAGDWNLEAKFSHGGNLSLNWDVWNVESRLYPICNKFCHYSWWQ